MEDHQKSNRLMKLSFHRIIEFISYNFHVTNDKICVCSNLNEDLKLEIWDKIELIIFLENNYNVKFPEDATSRFQTIFELMIFIFFNSYYQKTPST
jgi:acyl carrier protein